MNSGMWIDKSPRCAIAAKDGFERDDGNERDQELRLEAAARNVQSLHSNELTFLQGRLSILIFAQHALSLFATMAQSPFSTYWSKLTDPNRNPFRGLYQLNSFDLAIMIPYFLILVVLAAYGMYTAITWSTDISRIVINVPGPPPPGYRR